MLKISIASPYRRKSASPMLEIILQRPGNFDVSLKE